MCKCGSGVKMMYETYIKRILDFSIALLSMPFFLICFLFVAPAIVIEDGFPVFYNAERVGRNGKVFRMYKFRSMKNNAPDIRLADGSTYNAEDDPRVTKVGKVLRSTSIDEFPQVLNILKGEMSLIGPRPDPVDWLERYPEEVKVFLRVRPGITGYSQAFFRNSADGEEKMQNDVYYAKNCSLFLDLKIFFKTIQTVLFRENTYKETDATSNYLDEKAQKELDEIRK